MTLKVTFYINNPQKYGNDRGLCSEQNSEQLANSLYAQRRRHELPLSENMHADVSSSTILLLERQTATPAARVPPCRVQQLLECTPLLSWMWRPAWVPMLKERTCHLQPRSQRNCRWPPAACDTRGEQRPSTRHGYSQVSGAFGHIASVQGGLEPATPKAGSVTVAGAVMVGSEQLVAAGAGAGAGGAVGDASAAAAGAAPGRVEAVAAALVAAGWAPGPAKPAAAVAAGDAAVQSAAAVAAAAVSRGRTSRTQSPHWVWALRQPCPQEACPGCSRMGGRSTSHRRTPRTH